MSETRQKLYRAHVHFDHSGAHVFCHYGHLSPCGEWVEGGNDTRWRRTADWYETEAAAEASKAGEVAAKGAKMLEMAVKLLAAAREVPK
jgi:hypothetical protein